MITLKTKNNKMRLHITLAHIKACHPTDKPYPTDSYYQRLANRLYAHLQKRFVNVSMQEEDLPNIALTLIRYFEDIIADSGLWRAFSQLCEQKYGYAVPLYHDAEEYYPDELSLNAVRFLTWKTFSDMYPDKLIYADNKLLLNIAQEAYSLLDDEFDKAPVNDDLARDIDTLLDQAGTNFNSLRESLTWAMSCSYLNDSRNVIENKQKAIDELGDKIQLTQSMKEYFVNTKFLFNYKLSPLALLSHQWLKAVAEARGKKQLAAELGVIKVEKMDTWRMLTRTGNELSLESLHGHKITVPVEEFNIDEKQLALYDGLMASFVFYQDVWHLNGLLIPAHIKDRFEKMRQECRDIPQEGTHSYSSEQLKEMFGGRTLIYAKDGEEMIKLLSQKMKRINKTDLHELNTDKPMTVTLFIDDKEPFYNQFFCFDTAPCIKDSNNPFYDSQRAQAEALDMLWNEKRCTTHMAEYLVEHDMLPDAYHQPEFRPATSEIQQKADLLFFIHFYRSKNA